VITGVQLNLLIGPGVPVPAPSVVIDALTGVEVQSSKEQSGFQLIFAAGPNSPLLRTFLPAGYLDPMTTRVIIFVTVRGIPQVIMDGIVTQQQVSPAGDKGTATITVTGEDLSVLMDVVEMPFMRYPAFPKVAQLYTILSKYAVFGIVPVVIPPLVPHVKTMFEQFDTQTGTDREYIRQSARRMGYVFYLEPGPVPGTSIAYFGPDVRLPIPQPALSIDFGGDTNVESLSFTLDGMAKRIVVLSVFDPATRKLPLTIPLPTMNPLRPPLGVKPAVPSRVEFPDELSDLSPAEALERGLGMMFGAGDSISGEGSLEVSRYGRVLRSRMLVGVRGAGIAYDGLYYVNTVTHSIKRGEYKQSFNLSRDGLISLTPRVVP
jgi:hypothetical protein